MAFASSFRPASFSERIVSRQITVLMAISTQASVASNTRNRYWSKPSRDLISLKNNSVCQRHVYRSTICLAFRCVAFVISTLDVLELRGAEIVCYGRKHQSCPAYRADIRCFLMDVIRPWFRFQTDSPAGQSPMFGKRPFGRSYLDSPRLQPPPILQKVSHLWAIASGTFENSFGTRRKDPPKKTSPLAGILRYFGLVRGVSEDIDFGPVGHFDFVDHRRCGFGGRKMSHSNGSAALLGVVRYLQRNSIPRGGNKRREGEAMAVTPRVLVLLVAAPFFRLPRALSPVL